jgi:putative inorganic carbon (HCO3(-)) transporter
VGLFLDLAPPGLLALATVLWALPVRDLPFGLLLGIILVLWTFATPAARAAPVGWHVAIVGLLGTSALGLYPSIDLSMSLPRLYGVVLGVATLGVMAHGLSSERRLRVMGTIVLGLMIGLAAIALVTTDWFSDDTKGLGLDWIYALLPHLEVPILGQHGIHPNKVAAPLAMLLPIPVAAFLFTRGRLRLAWGVALLLVGLTLALTQSRSAYLAAGVALLALLIVRRRIFALLLVPCALLAAFAPVLIGTTGSVDQRVRSVQFTLADRFKVWELAAHMIRDFPITGIGLGTFPLVSELVYESPLFYGPAFHETPHAHNLALQIALDIGLPGLLFFSVLTICAALAARRAIVGPPSSLVRGLAAGAACGLLAYYVFGLTDAIGLGEKPGMIFWLLLGLVAACARLAPMRAGTSDAARPAGNDG